MCTRLCAWLRASSRNAPAADKCPLTVGRAEWDHQPVSRRRAAAAATAAPAAPASPARRPRFMRQPEPWRPARPAPSGWQDASSVHLESVMWPMRIVNWWHDEFVESGLTAQSAALVRQWVSSTSGAAYVHVMLLPDFCRRAPRQPAEWSPRLVLRRRG